MRRAECTFHESAILPTLQQQLCRVQELLHAATISVCIRANIRDDAWDDAAIGLLHRAPP